MSDPSLPRRLIQKPCATIRTSGETADRRGCFRNQNTLPIVNLFNDDRVLPPNRYSVALVRDKSVGYQSPSFYVRVRKIKSTITMRHGVLSANDQTERCGRPSALELASRMAARVGSSDFVGPYGHISKTPHNHGALRRNAPDKPIAPSKRNIKADR